MEDPTAQIILFAANSWQSPLKSAISRASEPQMADSQGSSLQNLVKTTDPILGVTEKQ